MVEFSREVQRVERVGVGVDVHRGIGDIVLDERDVVGHGAGANVGRRHRCIVGETCGDAGPCADADLDGRGEVGEAVGERVRTGHARGPISGVHVGTFMIAAS